MTPHSRTTVRPRGRAVVYTHAFQSPIGLLHGVVDREGRVLHVGFAPPSLLPGRPDVRENKYACGELELQVEQYFAGERDEFSLELRLEGTSFQKAVWSRLLRISYGETVTFGYVAQKIGRRDAARAVGNAIAANRLLLLVPCHRVVPASGGVGNYARRTLDADAGAAIKQQLLAMEQTYRSAPTSSHTSASAE